MQGYFAFINDNRNHQVKLMPNHFLTIAQELHWQKLKKRIIIPKLKVHKLMEKNDSARGEIRIVKGDTTIAKIGSSPIVIGREQLEPLMTEKLKAASISREHIRITPRDGRLYIEDFKPSKNGTWLVRDGQAIDLTGKKGETELLLSDEIILAKAVTLKLRAD